MSKAQELVSFMDNAVLRMPYEMVIGSPISQHQFYVRVQSLLDRLESASSEQQAARQDARDQALGRVAMQFVDRAGDVHPGVDDAETICAEFHHAMSFELLQWLPLAMLSAARASNGGKA